MSRRYQDQVEVRLGDPVEHHVQLEPGWCRGTLQEGGSLTVPTQFLWHGQVHLVRGVLARWSRRTPWWRPAGTEEQGGSVPLERQVWRVEASAGMRFGCGVYDLVQEQEAGWLLERVSD